MRQKKRKHGLMRRPLARGLLDSALLDFTMLA